MPASINGWRIEDTARKFSAVRCFSKLVRELGVYLLTGHLGSWKVYSECLLQSLLYMLKRV